MSRAKFAAIGFVLAAGIAVVTVATGAHELVTTRRIESEDSLGRVLFVERVARFGPSKGRRHGTCVLRWGDDEPIVLRYDRVRLLGARRSGEPLSPEGTSLAQRLATGLSMESHNSAESCISFLETMSGLQTEIAPGAREALAARKVDIVAQNSVVAIVLSDALGPGLDAELDTVRGVLVVRERP